MDIGIGLPSAIPWASGKQITEWARTAEERGFFSLGAIDRLVYGNSEPLVTLGAAAAVTSRNQADDIGSGSAPPAPMQPCWPSRPQP